MAEGKQTSERNLMSQICSSEAEEYHKICPQNIYRMRINIIPEAGTGIHTVGTKVPNTGRKDGKTNCTVGLRKNQLSVILHSS